MSINNWHLTFSCKILTLHVLQMAYYYYTGSPIERLGLTELQHKYVIACLRLKFVGKTSVGQKVENIMSVGKL